MSSVEKRRGFKERVNQGPILVAPGCYDAFSAKLVEHVGFEVVYMTGAGVSAGLVGVPDLGILTMTEMVETAWRIADAISLPIIADADTGYGGVLNVGRTVRQYEKAGVCAIHLEDQEIPKRCGHLEGKTVVTRGRMVDRIKAALDARTDPNFLIIARTDARATHGLAEAVERGLMCVEIGVDVVFIEAPESRSEVEEVGRAFRDIPLLINQIVGGKTPSLPAAELEKMGYDIVIFPGALQMAAGKTMIDLLKVLQTTGNAAKAGDVMMAFEERFEVLGLSRYRKLESRYINNEEEKTPKK